jgi:hypothetical protein
MRLFADDICVVGKNELEIRKAITLIERWAMDKEMILNKKKSGVMILFKRRNRKEEKYELYGYEVQVSWDNAGYDIGIHDWFRSNR